MILMIIYNIFLQEGSQELVKEASQQSNDGKREVVAQSTGSSTSLTESYSPIVSSMPKSSSNSSVTSKSSRVSVKSKASKTSVVEVETQSKSGSTASLKVGADVAETTTEATVKSASKSSIKSKASKTSVKSNKGSKASLKSETNEVSDLIQLAIIEVLFYSL